MHVHSAPDLFLRPYDHVDLVEQAKEAGMRAIVLKCHFSMTPFRAYLVKKIVGEGIDVLGGIVLNYAVGGLNPYAVDVAIKAGAKIIWMPTISAENHLKYYGITEYEMQKIAMGKLLPVNKGITPINKKGGLLSEAEEILRLIAESDTILATGHCSVEESKILVREAKKKGVKKIIATHVDQDFINMSIKDQIELANEGVYLERTLLPITPLWRSMSINEMVKRIKEVGAEHSIMSTDLGQIHNPSPVEGYRMFIQILLEKGISPNEINTMAKQNPTKLLGLEQNFRAN